MAVLENCSTDVAGRTLELPSVAMARDLVSRTGPAYTSSLRGQTANAIDGAAFRHNDRGPVVARRRI
jgi:hypothetical protein